MGRKGKNTPAAAPTTVDASRSKRHNSKYTKQLSSVSSISSSSLSVVKEHNETEQLIEEHLPPLALVFTILLCSGALMVLSMRDFFATGKIILGEYDANMLAFTKSMEWFDDSKGWKSQQGGLSAISQVTTDKNNMGGFFVRKLAGAAGIAVHLQKLWPLLMHPNGAKWAYGHFRPLLWTALVSNIGLSAFYVMYLPDLQEANAAEMTYGILGFLVFESLVMMAYLWASRRVRKDVAVAMTDGKTPTSYVSGIVTRTISLVTFIMAIIAGRDLFFPGTIIDIIPRDDIYLEWTGALLHSPPANSPEAIDHGLESPFYVGNKFVGQLMALNLLILCLYKFVSAWGLQYGNDGRGEVQARMFWKTQAVGDALVLFCMRLFTPAARTASLDFRWHLMCLAYETFILGMYGFF